MGQEQSEQQGPPNLLELRVWVDAQGNTNVHGPIDREVLCVGALAMAIRVIQDWNARARQARAEQAARERIEIADVAGLKAALNGRHPRLG